MFDVITFDMYLERVQLVKESRNILLFTNQTKVVATFVYIDDNEFLYERI